LLVVLGAIGSADVARAEPFRFLTIEGAAVRWQPNAPNGAVVLKYAILQTHTTTQGAVNCGEMRPPSELLQLSEIRKEEFRRAVLAAFERWQGLADISFVEVHDQSQADIVIGEQVEPQGFAFTNVVLAPPLGDTMRGIASAQICLNPQKRWKIGFDGNLAVYDLVHSIAHEIGHAIGLDHPAERGQLMSFRYHETRAGLSNGDVQGAIQLYGKREVAPSASAAIGDKQRFLME